MKVEFIKHSSFCVELDRCILLFDYYKGILPEFNREKALIVFVSHRHEDHFSRKIFELENKYKRIYYIISDDIDKSAVTENKNVNFIGAGEDRTYNYGEGQIRVRTLKSTDEGVAFLLDVEGRRIYFGADLNYWYWKEEGSEWNDSQKQAYSEELGKLKAMIEKDSKGIELAFAVLDNRQQEHAYLGITYFMQLVGAKYVFPMHINGSLDIIDKLKACPDMKGFSDRIIGIKNDNEVFDIC